jgi:alpha-L-fucosidase
VQYEPTWESVRQHPLPAWYDDAKLGVFVHWGLYSVPGWAPQVPDIQTMLVADGPQRMLRDNPYAEWYLNTMRIPGSPTRRHHRETYGADFPYDGFRPMFDEGTAHCDLDAIAGLAQEAGAGYLVLTTKHHDGFALWPSAVPHPTKGEYHAARDLVGGLTDAVRARGLRMGLYYSGAWDWPYNDAVLRQGADIVLATPEDPEYLAYITAHWRELIDRYQPSLMWNDIGWPRDEGLAGLFADYYNAVPDGVINDRWVQSTFSRNRLSVALLRAGGRAIQAAWRFIPEERKRLTFPGAKWFDFTTPEYESLSEIREKKWESTRGVGHSFGANRNERPEDIVTAAELVRSLCDIVAKNGNLLIGVGPDERGAIPEQQAAPLRGLGAWMARNGDALRGTRPWEVAGSTTDDGTEVRFTVKAGVVHALLLARPGGREFAVEGIDAVSVSEAVHLGTGATLTRGDRAGTLTLALPEGTPDEDAHAIRLGPGVRRTGISP